MVSRNTKEIFNIVKSVVTNKKFQLGLTIVLFLIILYSSTSIRLSNLPALKDSTTGLYTSNDLDSLYFYRQAQTLMDNGGHYPTTDALRTPQYNTTWIHEVVPYILIGLFKIEKLFSPTITFDYSATISAPIIYSLLLVAFFILCWLITKSKFGSLLASSFLAFAPAFLFRSIAGFYDHDHVGVFAVILLLIIFLFSLKNFEKNIKNSFIYGLISGLFTTMVLISWGGAITFVLLVIPVASLIYYLLNNKKRENFLLFYAIWFSSSGIFAWLFGQGLGMFNRYLDSYGIVSTFVLGFVIIDYLLGKNLKNISFLKEKYEKFYSFGMTIILGILGLIILGKNPLSLVEKIWATLIYPFFGDFGTRLSSTVAENAQPYLQDLISQTMPILFWLFILGMFFTGVLFVKHLTSLKYRIILAGSIFFMFVAILFSRYSSGGLFNGENLVSQIFYIIGILVFIYCFIYVYLKERFSVDAEYIILFALVLTVVVNARAAIRSFFLITPFICLLSGLAITEMVRIAKGARDETFKYTLWALVIITLILSFALLFGNPVSNTPGSYQITSNQAKYIGPSTNSQWQNAMVWAKNNTNKNDIFVHWWDYGYFIQTLAGRPTVTDGGHAGGGNTDHFIGRYILTTPDPKTAYSFMKTWNVSYLLIDPTELGKYGAFSKIGSNDSWDRVSTGISAGISDDKQMQETSTGIVRIYNLGVCVDGDIEYTENQTSVFLPGISITAQQRMNCNSYLGGIILEIQNDKKTNVSNIKQPTGVFIYNNKQYRIPIKNVFFDGKMISFPSGLDSVAYLIPRVDETSGKIDAIGAVMYLSPRTFNSLVGRLYVLDDYYGEYSELTVADKEDDPAVKYFKQYTGAQLNEFIYYQGLRAPLKIWRVNYPLGTNTHEEFFNPNFTFGGLDYLFE